MKKKKQIAVFFTRGQWFMLTRIPPTGPLWEENIKRAKYFAMRVTYQLPVGIEGYLHREGIDKIEVGKIYFLDTLAAELHLVDNREWD